MNSIKTKSDYNNQVSIAVDQFLNKNDIVEFKKGIEILREVYFEITGLGDEVKDLNDEITELEGGVAISPHNAIACLNEIMRTARFMRGVYKAINHALNIFPGQRIHLVYAGSGPLAPLVIPILHLFSSEQLKITFIDIHERSIKLLKLIINKLELNDYVNEILCTDAVKYQHSEEDPIHIVLSETMCSILRKEPQFAITLNYANQIAEKGILIPQNIAVSLQCCRQTFISSDEESTYTKERTQVFLGDIFNLNLDAVKKINSNNNLHNKFGENIILANEIEIPSKLEDGCSLQICTDINVFADETLNIDDCSLTIPRTLNLNGLNLFGKKLKFHYAIGKLPEFRYSIGKKNMFHSLIKIFKKEAK